MNTEARVLATLNKIKEVQSKRKDLGAIEDAIQGQLDAFNEKANNLKLFMDNLASVTSELNDAYRQFQPILETFKELYRQSDGYDEDYNSLLGDAEELDTYGINTGPTWMMIDDLWGSVLTDADDLNRNF